MGGFDRLGHLLEHAPLVLFELDRYGAVVWCGGRVLEHFGLSAEEWLGRSVVDQFRDVPWIVENVRRSLAGELRSASGAVGDLWYEAHYVPVRDARGEVTGVLGLVLDITERMHAKLLLDNVDAIVWTAELPSLRITFLSERTAAVLGAPIEELVGTTALWGLLHPEDREATLEALRSVSIENERQVVHRMVMKDGSTRQVVTSARTLRSQDGRVTRLLGVAVDITERTRALEALEGGATWLRLIVDQLPVIIWTTDRQLRFTSGVGAGLEALGLGADQLTGLSLYDYFQTNDPQHPIISKVRSVLEQERPTSYESSWQGRTYRTHALPFRDRSGELIGALALSLDISDLREYERRLRAQADRSRLVAEFAGLVAQGVEDTDSILQLTVRRLIEMLGDSAVLALATEDGRWLEPRTVDSRDPEQVEHARRELIGARLRPDEGPLGLAFETGCTLFIPNPDPRELEGMVSAHGSKFLERFPIHSLILVPLRARGRTLGSIIITRTLEPRPYTEADKQLVEEVAHIAALSIDNARLLREARHAETQLRQAQKMEALGRLAGGIAHDFNNLMVVVLSYTDLLMTELRGDDPRRADLEQIQIAGRRAANLTNQLLTFSRRRVAQTKILALDELIESMLIMLRRVIREDIELATSHDRNLWKIRADPDQISQMILNLTVNARDAMPQGGRLTIETRNMEVDRPRAAANDAKPGPYVMLSTSDTGVGMTPETKSHLFEPFFTTKEPGKGTGLGLATIFGVIRQVGGFIEVESEVDRGSTFRIFIPGTKETEETKKEPARAPAASGRSELILVVEDDEAVRTLVTRILQKSGYQVIEAGLPSEAIRLCETEHLRPALVLTDIVMPQMSGVALAERLSAVLPDMPVLYMSGYSANAIAENHLLGPDFSYVPKPFTRDELIHRVDLALAKRRS